MSLESNEPRPNRQIPMLQVHFIQKSSLMANILNHEILLDTQNLTLIGFKHIAFVE